MVRRVAFACLIVLAAAGAFATHVCAHPLHTTLTELTVASDGTIQIVLRAFVDDFSAAVTGRPAPPGAPIATPPDSATGRYIRETVALTDAAGRPAVLVIASMRRTDDLLWITVRAPALRSLAGARLSNRVLFERWDDQVNIVQTSVGGRRQTLLFTRREGNAAKAI